MKTKNILRTLLMAVTLLLGAEQAQAQETTVWEGNFDQYNVLKINSLTNVQSGDKLRVNIFFRGIRLYGTWNNNIGSGYEGCINYSDYNAEGGYFEHALNDNAVAVLKQQGLKVSTNNADATGIRIKKVSLVNGSSETELWTGDSDNPDWIANSDRFQDVATSTKIRVYCTLSNYGKIDFHSWSIKFPFPGTDNGLYTCTAQDAARGYVEVQFDDATATLAHNNSDFLLGHQGLGFSKVTLISGGTTPVDPPVGPTTYTITYMVNGAVYTTQNYAAGASISLPAQPTMEGFSFVGWDGMPTNLIMPDQSITVTAMWSAASYDVSASYNSQFGAVSINNTGNDFTTAQAGSTVYVTCTPYSGYYVQSVSLNTGGTVSGSDNSYSFTMPTQAVTVYVTFVAGTVNAPITSTTQLATFSSTYALDFSDVTALKAYIVTGTNNGYAILERVTGTVAPNTGLIIYGATADIPIALSGDTKSSNKLIATTSDTNVSGSGNYVLSVKSGDAVFAETSTASANVPANHAYLRLGGAAARRYLSIKVSNETTGINSIEAEGNAIEQTFYNLNGQRVETPTRGGIYIVNGKKVLMK